MLRIQPFAALRPRPELAARVASVPYDVVNTEEARSLAEGNPLSFLHVVRSEIDLPEGSDPHAPAVYEKAQENLRRLEEQALLRESEPCVYLYRQEMVLLGERVSQVGLVCCCHVEDYRNGVIKRHEKTRRDKEDDRTRHVLALRANTGPVFLMYRDQPDVAEQVARDSAREPLYDFESPDGVHHTVWRSSDAALYQRAFENVSVAYVADGHHRSASAARAASLLAAENPNHRGDEEYNWFLSVLFPASQLAVLPYNRVVKNLGGMTPEALLERLRAVARVEPTQSPAPEAAGSFGMYLDGHWYRVTLPEASIDRTDPVASLDYMLLYERILAPILSIGEIRTDDRIDFVGGIRGIAELVRRVDSGRDAVAFAMRATTIEELFRVADAGAIMPPKSTWFEPKLRSGLLTHLLA